MQTQVETKDFKIPDDQLNFKTHGQIDVIKLSDGTVGMLARLEPGWKWSQDEKPLLGNPDSCPMAHTGYCMAGELVIEMVDTHQESHIKAGDFFVIPPGHDGYVLGDQACELILFQAPEHAHTH
jgi:hypothetical protein